ncbi:hypothetical protein QTP88_020794 [Uroleucon formosanum]
MDIRFNRLLDLKSSGTVWTYQNTFKKIEQHVDARLSRISRDTNDLNILLKWFSSHPPFLELNEIISISTGVIGDTTINCHNAYEIGLIEMKKIIGQTYGTVKLKRSNRVLPIAILNSSIRIREEIISIDPLFIFQRISIMKTSNEELKSYFEYELSPYPLSLFNEMGTRKTKKSILYDFIQSSNLESFTLGNALYVIDGGFLLHRVMWQLNLTFNQIFQLYLSYIRKHFGTNAVIVFDGYNESSTSTKNMERNRRVKNTSADILFDENMVPTVAQTSFLSNIRNKSRLIQMLSSYLIGKGYIIKQANDDADTVIVNEAIKRTQSQSVVVVGQDIDLLVLLIALTPVENQIIFLKPGNGGNEKKIYSIQDIQKVNGIKMSILFLHAISGCDTVSCFYNIGKLKHFKLLNQFPELQGIVNVFNCPNSTPENIFKAEERYTLKLYGAPQSQTNIDEYRYLLFTRKTAGNKFKLASLPPSKEALKQHIYRTYHQVQMWHGEEKNAKDWGWQTTRNGLQPIFSWNEPAPKCILEKITCACTKNCGAACGCRKQGLKCSTACKTCSGLSCLNCEQQIIEEESDDNSNEDEDEIVYGPSSKRKK